MQWAAWNAVSPIGDERLTDVGPALIRRTLHQVHGDKRDLAIEDFLPFKDSRYENDGEDAWMRWAEKYGVPG